MTAWHDLEESQPHCSARQLQHDTTPAASNTAPVQHRTGYSNDPGLREGLTRNCGVVACAGDGGIMPFHASPPRLGVSRFRDGDRNSGFGVASWSIGTSGTSDDRTLDGSGSASFRSTNTLECVTGTMTLLLVAPAVDGELALAWLSMLVFTTRVLPLRVRDMSVWARDGDVALAGAVLGAALAVVTSGLGDVEGTDNAGCSSSSSGDGPHRQTPTRLSRSQEPHRYTDAGTQTDTSSPLYTTDTVTQLHRLPSAQHRAAAG